MASQSNTHDVITITLIIHKETKKLLFAEAHKDFIDFLFHIPSLPLGHFLSLQDNHDHALNSKGSLGILYESIKNLNQSLIQPKFNNNRNSILAPINLTIIQNSLKLAPKNITPNINNNRTTNNTNNNNINLCGPPRCGYTYSPTTPCYSLTKPTYTPASPCGCGCGGLSGPVRGPNNDQEGVTNNDSLVEPPNSPSYSPISPGYSPVGSDYRPVSPCGCGCGGLSGPVGGPNNDQEDVTNNNSLVEPSPSYSPSSPDYSYAPNFATPVSPLYGPGPEIEEDSIILNNNINQEYDGNSSSGVMPSEGYVKGVTYIVKDDLSVKPMLAIECANMLNEAGALDANKLERKEVQVGIKEGMALLKASMVTRNVLTSVFLENKAGSSKGEKIDYVWYNPPDCYKGPMAFNYERK